MKKIALALIGITLLSCGTKKEAKEALNDKKAPIESTITAKVKVGEFVKENDPLTIDTAYTVGNMLYIDVTYGGGCADHEFELIGSPAIAKSYPAQRAIQLVHHSNNDRCKALVKKTVVADVSELTDNQNEGNVIMYNLDGYKPKIEHVYSKPKKK